MLFNLFFTWVNLSFGLGENIRVDVKHGPVRGYVMIVGEHPVYAFKNIPYAKPPVGNLRLQLPEEHGGWLSENDLPQNAEIRCPQNAFHRDEVVSDVILGQEDCLVLDIYVRKDHVLENSSLPVLIYFHGGNFNIGSKEDYGPDYLLRYNDIILVVPNYRLGILGFLSFQDAVLPGNVGLWDQNAVLKWVSINIEQFGGDPNRVTIAGHEAGAASVGLHMLASTSHDYFQRAISDSGTALSPWLVDVNPSPSTADEVADVLRCPTLSKKEKLECLKTAPLDDILKIQGKVRKPVFIPTIDNMAKNPFIPLPPKYLYLRGHQKNISYMVGYAERGAAYEVSREFPNVLKYQHLDKMIQHFLKPHFINAPNFQAIAIAAKYHYLRRIMIPSFESIEPHIARMMTDFLYKSPLEQIIKLHRQETENIFVYKLKSETQNACGSEYRRCFGDEFYVFNMTSRQNVLDSIHLNNEKRIEILSNIWGNFIKLGYPDVHGKWKPYKNDQESHYAEISDVIKPKVNYASDDIEFWITLVSELNAAPNASEKHYSDEHQTAEYLSTGTWGITGLVVLSGVLCIALVGVVIITKRRTMTVSIVPVSSPREKFISS